jgi:hypothetical protein
MRRELPTAVAHSFASCPALAALALAIPVARKNHRSRRSDNVRVMTCRMDMKFPEPSQ